MSHILCNIGKIMINEHNLWRISEQHIFLLKLWIFTKWEKNKTCVVIKYLCIENSPTIYEILKKKVLILLRN